MGIHPGLRRQLVAKQLESPDCRRSTIDGHTTAPILLITVVVDNAFRATSAIQWHSFCQGPMTGMSPADGIKGLTSTYYYYVDDRACYDRDCAAKFTGAQGGEAGPTVGGHACTAKERAVRHRSQGLSSGQRADTAARHDEVNVLRKDERQTACGCARREPKCQRRRRGRGAPPMVRPDIGGRILVDCWYMRGQGPCHVPRSLNLYSWPITLLSTSMAKVQSGSLEERAH
ncbi:uncharacterized protein [Triticum aestivum]|uniref:uncharacterized protein isoform X1 n=1 Tax=Triticum aestivum TaxID=4565 RepID=UPI0008448EF4|nr:uncharacterized protein LOC123163135 isoform X1 [Triticum aestivum]